MLDIMTYDIEYPTLALVILKTNSCSNLIFLIATYLFIITRLYENCKKVI